MNRCPLSALLLGCLCSVTLILVPVATPRAQEPAPEFQESDAEAADEAVQDSEVWNTSLLAASTL